MGDYNLLEIAQKTINALWGVERSIRGSGADVSCAYSPGENCNNKAGCAIGVHMSKELKELIEKEGHNGSVVEELSENKDIKKLMEKEIPWAIRKWGFARDLQTLHDNRSFEKKNKEKIQVLKHWIDTTKLTFPS